MTAIPTDTFAIGRKVLHTADKREGAGRVDWTYK